MEWGAYGSCSREWRQFLLLTPYNAAMLHLEGDKSFSASPAELWAKLTDLAFLVQCVPDVAKVNAVEAKAASLVLRPGFSFVRGEMQLTIEKLEESPPAMARMLMKTKGIGTSSEVEAVFQLAEQNG